MKRTLYKVLSMLLTAAMVLNIGLNAVFAEGANPPGISGVCTHHTGHTKDCPLYTEPELSEAVQALIAMVDALPNAADITEENREATKAAFEAAGVAYEALSDEDKAAFQATEQYTKLTALQAVLFGTALTSTELDLLQRGDQNQAALSLDEQLAYMQLAQRLRAQSGIMPMGHGDTDMPFQIGTAVQLADLAAKVNAGNADFNAKSYILVNDISLAAYQSGTGWAPIGNDGNLFKGTFDGGGKIITGLVINNPDTDFQGLFGAIGPGGTVENLGVVDCNITGNSTVGGVAGKNNSSIQNCAALNPSVSSNDDVGRVVGENDKGTLTGNYAWSGMTGGGNNNTADGTDGADLTCTDGTLDKQFSEIFSDNAAWEFADNKLPILAGVGGSQSSDLPVWMTTAQSTDTFIISTAEQLAKLATEVNGGDNKDGKTYILSNNISLSASVTGSRPVYDFKVTGGGKNIINFGNAKLSLSIPYELKKVDENGKPSDTDSFETSGNLVGVYVDASGKTTYLPNSSYNAASKAMLIGTNHLSLYGVAYKTNAPIFTDTANHWAKDDIQFVAARGLLTGTTATTFSPNTSMTRGMFVTALTALSGKDMAAVVGGNRADTVSREEMAVIMQSYANAIGYKLPNVHKEISFTDSSKISTPAKPVVRKMQMAGILIGKDGGKFDPTGTATRAEGSAMLRRFVELVANSETAKGWTQNDSGNWMYFEKGKAVTGKKKIDGTTYKFDPYGVTALLPKDRRYAV